MCLLSTACSSLRRSSSLSRSASLGSRCKAGAPGEVLRSAGDDADGTCTAGTLGCGVRSPEALGDELHKLAGDAASGMRTLWCGVPSSEAPGASGDALPGLLAGFRARASDQPRDQATGFGASLAAAVAPELAGGFLRLAGSRERDSLAGDILATAERQALLMERLRGNRAADSAFGLRSSAGALEAEGVVATGADEEACIDSSVDPSEAQVGVRSGCRGGNSSETDSLTWLSPHSKLQGIFPSANSWITS